jgi:hypothetical protein
MVSRAFNAHRFFFRLLFLSAFCLSKEEEEEEEEKIFYGSSDKRPLGNSAW